eukprot:2581251-Alexandrium_andersonii.AAC.1
MAESCPRGPHARRSPGERSARGGPPRRWQEGPQRELGRSELSAPSAARRAARPADARAPGSPPPWTPAGPAWRRSASPSGSD